MRKISAIVCVAVLCFGMSGVAMAGDSDTITVTCAVSAINEIAIDDASVSLTINAAVAGAEPTDVTDAGTYDITTNCADNAKKLTAQITTGGDMPAGVVLSLNVTAPSGGATSAGYQNISASASAVDVVTGIDGVAAANVAFEFKLSTTAAIGVVGSTEKTVTLTLTAS